MATTSLIDVVMPQVGVSVSGGIIVKWLKQDGEPVERDEALLVISIGKVDLEVLSPGSGVLERILVAEGQTVPVGTRVGVIAHVGAPVRILASAPPARTGEEAAPSIAAARQPTDEPGATPLEEPTSLPPGLEQLEEFLSLFDAQAFRDGQEAIARQIADLSEQLAVTQQALAQAQSRRRLLIRARLLLEGDAVRRDGDSPRGVVVRIG